MIGRPEWFTRRKYGGWGLYPKTWQGWLYLAIFLAVIFGTQFLPLDQITKLIILIVITLFLVIDTISIMARLKKDEREKIHEALAERNALWAIIAVLAAGLAYQVASSTAQQKVAFDPVILIALALGLLVKAISNIYLDRKD